MGGNPQNATANYWQAALLLGAAGLSLDHNGPGTNTGTQMVRNDAPHFQECFHQEAIVGYLSDYVGNGLNGVITKGKAPTAGDAFHAAAGAYNDATATCALGHPVGYLHKSVWQYDQSVTMRAYDPWWHIWP